MISDDNFYNRPVLWKNCSLKPLPLPDENESVFAHISSVVVNENDVYVCGSLSVIINNFALRSAILWKNGTIVYLSNALSNSSNSITIHGDDIYVTGFYGYWKNGLFVSKENVFHIRSIAFSGEDMYLMGVNIPVDQPNNFISGYWKNDSIFVALPTANFRNSYPVSMEIIDDDVHIVGALFNDGLSSVNNTVAYWKNGILEFTIDNEKSNPSSFKLNNSLVYISGVNSTDEDWGVYWVNRQKFLVPGCAGALSIFIK